jgi:hypothetical protein
MATAASKRAVQTPGEKTNAADSAAPVPAAPLLNAAPVEYIEGESENDFLKRQITAQGQQIAALISAVQNVNRATPSVAPVEDLPSIEGADTSILTAPTLFKEGWFVPPAHGSNPAQKKA